MLAPLKPIVIQERDRVCWTLPNRRVIFLETPVPDVATALLARMPVGEVGSERPKDVSLPICTSEGGSEACYTMSD